MTGNNEFWFNHATMCEIVQYYLDNKMLNKDEHSPRVKAVCYDSACMMFEIKVDCEQQKAA